MGSNWGGAVLAFQEWRHFKEAFAPELVARAIDESPIPVRRCVDPFGGSGTTALACQFLGVEPITVEVNPYLADLIEAKLTIYDADDVVHDLGRVLRHAVRRRARARLTLPDGAPPTLVQPGLNDRWVFDKPVARRLGALIEAILQLPDERHRRLFRVLLGDILLAVSNVVVNGKGRRYRRRWEDRRRDPRAVELYFSSAVRRAVTDIHTFSSRSQRGFNVVRGDARHSLADVEPCDLAVFSPPYPNSFDYTDVYNLELWVLGYLGERSSNRVLRQSTLCSHVQIERDYPKAPAGSATLDRALLRLCRGRSQLWHPRIPDMVGGYFADLLTVLSHLREILRTRASVWAVVGDSRYLAVRVRTAQILEELAIRNGFKVIRLEPFRSMRSSAQQGGRHELTETLVVLRRR